VRFARWLRRWREPSRDVDAALREALRRVLDDDLDAAEELLARAVRADSGRIDAYLALARLYRRRGETGRAIRLHQNLLLRTDLPAGVRDEALLGLAGDFRQGGFLQRAIAAYEEVLARRPRDVVALRALVRLHADVRQYPRALALARLLARVEGRDGRAEEAELLVEAAEAAHAEGRSDDARRALKRALRRDPGHARAWIDLGHLEAERGRTKRALQAWERVPQVDARRAADVYPRLEAAYAAMGRAREFETALRGILAQRPGDAFARLALVHTLAARGDADAAVNEARALLERDPEDLRAHAALARVFVSEGREPEAVKELGELLDVIERQGLLVPREHIE
jgi:lipopolysaccharide biosynthesis regulator YciM